MKKFVFLVLFLMVCFSGIVNAQENVSIANVQEDSYDDGFELIAQEDIYEGIADIRLTGDAGITPDSALYFIEILIEDIFVGDNPETALNYKEEKLMEFKEMMELGNSEAAKKALERVEKYNIILKKEVTPDLDTRVRESSKATKVLLASFEEELKEDKWDEVNLLVEENMKLEDKIALAAKISKKIKSLCEDLSVLDPLEYSKMCKTDDDAPKWKKDMDQKLTEEQKIEAKEFFNIMSNCFQNPSECACDDISVKPFAEQCNVIAPLAAECESGNEDACEKMEDVDDPIDLLPDYLRDVMDDVEDKYGDAKYDLHIPSECVEAGALSKDACMKIMFKLNAPIECQEALESGKIDPSNEREAKDACETIMFEINAPQECIDAGFKDRQECDRHMFKLDAPQECIDAGLTGSGRDDWKKCDIIRFRLDAPKECIDAGITGEKRDDWKKCEAIRFRLDSPQECIDAGLTGEGRDDWKKCEAIRFRLEAPEECIDAGLDGNGRDDWKKCEAIRFRLDAPKECLDKGLTGEGRDDWKKCDAIRFVLEAHPSCIDAGLDGTGRDDWRACQKIQFKAEAPKECLAAGLDGMGRYDWDDCNRIMDANQQEEDMKHEDDMNQNDPYKDCGAVDCKQGYYCEYGKCIPEGSDDEFSECKDGCNDECPGADRTDCVNNRCECYYDEHTIEDGSGSDGANGDETNVPVDVPSSDDGTVEGGEGIVDDTTGDSSEVTLPGEPDNSDSTDTGADGGSDTPTNTDSGSDTPEDTPTDSNTGSDTSTDTDSGSEPAPSDDGTQHIL